MNETLDVIFHAFSDRFNDWKIASIVMQILAYLHDFKISSFNLKRFCSLAVITKSQSIAIVSQMICETFFLLEIETRPLANGNKSDVISDLRKST